MLAKILVVDDELPVESLIRQQFRKKIRAKEWEFIFASNGVEALNKIQADDQIDMVLTDINMPEMDGLTLLEKLKEVNPDIKTVVVSAYGDLGKIRTAMNRGAFDFVTKPIDFQDLEITINRTLECVRQIQENQEQLRQVQAQLIQKERMSTIGQLVTGVAYEINNPLSFLRGNLSYLEENIPELLNLLYLYRQHDSQPVPAIKKGIEAIEPEFFAKDVPKLFSSMKAGLERIHKISMFLQTFSGSATSPKMTIDIHEGLESVLLILQHRLKASGDRPAIEVIREYGDLPLVECYPNSLNQVFMNIMANAIDSIKESITKGLTPRNPAIQIRTEVIEDNSIAIRIADNGSGITEEAKQQLFEPRLTTKPTEKGTELGLFISRQIVMEKHGGQLTCRSTPDLGTEFIIEMPMRQPMKA